MLAGAVGNFIDRVRLGYVVDMFKLEFMDFPVFNFADTCLSLGVIFFIIYLLFFESKEE
ncbi:signal peptidase II [Aerococcus urinae]